MKEDIIGKNVSPKVGYILLGMIIMLLITSLIVPAFAAQTHKQLNAAFMDIKIVINGETITPRDPNGNIVEPFIVDGTTYLPVRAICEAIDYEVEWDGATNTVHVYSSVNHAK
ncbi:MAG: copper amine oxidase N-terminal domain-containing protein [Clostridiaceae bacterium]|nr:copper amine oxidase N-terminal domain-containing protein [Clostridiaceae bacterium]